MARIRSAITMAEHLSATINAMDDDDTLQLLFYEREFLVTVLGELIQQLLKER